MRSPFTAPCRKAGRVAWCTPPTRRSPGILRRAVCRALPTNLLLGARQSGACASCDDGLVREPCPICRLVLTRYRRGGHLPAHNCPGVGSWPDIARVSETLVNQPKSRRETYEALFASDPSTKRVSPDEIVRPTRVVWLAPNRLLTSRVFPSRARAEVHASQLQRGLLVTVQDATERPPDQDESRMSRTRLLPHSVFPKRDSSGPR